MNTNNGNKWETVRTRWADVCALLLGAVRAFTVTLGAMSLQGLPPAVLGMLGIAVAGLTFDIERRLTDRLQNPIAPQQSLPALLLAWLPPLAVVTTLNSLLAFSLGVSEMGQAQQSAAYRAHWVRESNRASEWLLNARTGAAQLLATTQADITTEQARVAAARRDNQPYSTDALTGLRRRTTATRDVAKQAAAIPSLPVEPPTDRASANDQSDALFRGLADLYPSATAILPTLPAPPRPEAFEPPAVDLKTLFVTETSKRSGPAVMAWGSACLLECLGFIALWRGGRRVAFGTRIRDWRRRTGDASRAVFSNEEPVTLSITVEPVGIAGIVYLRLHEQFTANECLPMIQDTLSKHPLIGKRSIARLKSSAGRDIQANEPLLAQLGGRSLVAELGDAA